ncbi:MULTISPECIES: efflux RND transporter periplasmic adaptor subunit [Flavobacteriaceae]|uniref:Efflux RND transporter periplasmic adaptor subunit n=1 Tax=Polaribacter ponticola TaxID=2978475 RepID=A0ABT5S6R1_9FLAO|nr:MULTISPECIES: efflux RND transporter periplasmic adaptor subunit [Flavobacteriaceae]MCT4698240.1 efflux RND transporter periplasmic adaptor subunit [Tenacibaculum haliotis]MDD7913784.1 efflux RND transporter periplasmic adaptor subunit [Polaribacter sp. MSW5]
MKKLVILMGLFMLIVQTSCESKKEEKKEHTAFLVTNPIKKDTTITKDYVSQIHAIRHIEVRALEKGYLKSISVDEGQNVKKGQAMFQIMPNIYQAELQKAQAESNVAEIELKNTKLLADGNVVSQNELAMASANYDKSKAEVSLAQTHLGFTQIKAPFDGIMDHLEVREGSLLDEGELLTKLSDNSKMWVYFNVPEAQYLDYMMNDHKDDKEEVRLLLANNREFNQKGIVETIEGEFNNETGNIAFRATFPNPDGVLRHGQTGSILMTVPFKDVILIPQKATFEVLDKTYVFIVDKENKVRQREITIGAELPNIYVISKGLSETDTILLEGIRMVKNNEEIHTKFEEPKKVLESLDLYAE